MGNCLDCKYNESIDDENLKCHATPMSIIHTNIYLTEECDSYQAAKKESGYVSSGDWRKVVYWMAAATLTTVVTW